NGRGTLPAEHVDEGNRGTRGPALVLPRPQTSDRPAFAGPRDPGRSRRPVPGEVTRRLRSPGRQKLRTRVPFTVRLNSPCCSRRASKKVLSMAQSLERFAVGSDCKLCRETDIA